MIGRRLSVSMVAVCALALPLGLLGPAASAAGNTHNHGGATTTAPPAPSGGPTGSAASTASASGGGAGSASALVLYDTTGPYGKLGELYAMATANLASHFGSWHAEPVTSYASGQVNNYTATIYLGSTYDEVNSAPQALVDDVTTTSRPVIWVGYNIWDVANRMSGGAAAFKTRYGWDATQSFLTAGVTGVVYKGTSLTRTVPSSADGGVVDPAITNATLVTTIATAVDATTGNFPWAVRSANLTYIGEIPFSYVTETDRVVAFEDLLFDALAPSTSTRHRALLRLEDISCDADPADLNADESYLAGAHVSYGIAVIPHYKDPLGVYNNGQPVDTTLAQCPKVLKAVKNMLSHGAVLVDHGDTHQYSDQPNPYNTNTTNRFANPYTGVTADDFEFFLTHIDANNNVIYDAPVPNDSATFAQRRVNDALNIFSKAGVSKPAIWEFPHYAASATDYRTIATNFGTRWDRGLYYSGLLSGATIDPTSYIGQFFPYVVTDVYGTKVLPEDMGNYEPEALNNHPPRLVPDLLRNSAANLAVRDGFAAFFFHPYYPLSVLQQLVQGVQQQGYAFVSPSSL